MFKRLFTYTAALVSLAAAVVTIFDFWDKIASVFDSDSSKFESEEICAWDQCLADNRKFIEFVKKNAGKTVTVNVLLDISIGAGDFHSICYDDLVLESDWGGNDYNVIAILPNLTSCKPEGRILISYRAEDKIAASAVTGLYQDRLYGEFIITLRHWGGPLLYEFQKI